MLTLRFALQRRGPKRLELRRSLDWGDVAIRLDGVELRRTNRDELLEGLDVPLPDHSVLNLRLEPGPRGAMFLYLTRNGHPLPGTDGDPVTVLHQTVATMGIFAAVQILFSALVAANGRADATIYWILAAGSVLAILCLFAWHHSVPATIAAALICLGELVALFATDVQHNVGNVLRMGIGLGLLGWFLLRGIGAARELKAITLPIRHPPEPPTYTSTGRPRSRRRGHHPGPP
jgi:hypothetical protein